MMASTVELDAPSSEARLPLTRTVQAFERGQTVEWMEDSGIWGVSYPISGDALAELKAMRRLGEEAVEGIFQRYWMGRAEA